MNNRIRNIGVILLLLVWVLTALTTSTSVAQKPAVGQAVAPAGGTGPQSVFYQGFITVGDEPYEGTGYFKFAVVNAAGNVTYWSNNATSTNGSEPTAAVSLGVEQGYFGVLLGDTTLVGMSQVLDPMVFAEAGRHLRVWFAASVSGPFTRLSLVPMAAVPYAMNADLLDGYHADELFCTGSFSGGDQEEQLTTTDKIVRSVVIDAPAPGIVIVNASGFADFNGSDLDAISCSITPETTVDTNYQMLSSDFGATSSTSQLAPFALTRGFDVSSGTYTYNLVCKLGTASSLVEAQDTNINAIFIPSALAGTSFISEGQSSLNDQNK
ncbi:MAG: hypothetical protein JXA89_06875 [Anaerolineae bacterium]|nr:hypothetical protein [Anaerolineae bacterium]